MRYFFVVLALLLGLTSAQAEIAGQNDPQFKAALELWLQGDDDLAALTALSKLAKADNRAAQVFLGRVDLMRHTHSHVTDPMDRKTRNSLLRAGSGAFGKNWLRIAEVDTPLASAFQLAKKVREKLRAIVLLLEFQEYTAATKALYDSMGAISGDDFIPINEVLKHSTLPIHLRNYFHSTEEFSSSGNRKPWITFSIGTNYSKEQLLQQDAFNWPVYSWVDLTNGKITASEIDPVIVNNPVFAPLQNLCRKACGDDVPKCMRALNGTPFGGALWLKLSSPTETMLPTDDYQSSARISDDLKRLLRTTKVLFRTTKVQQDWFDLLKRYDQCAYQAVFAE